MPDGHSARSRGDAGCPSDSLLLAFLAGTLPAGAASAIDEHIERCTSCFALLSDLGRAGTALSPSSAGGASEERGISGENGDFPDRGAARPLPDDGDLGGAARRYELRGRIGQGGMGTVYRALDRLTGTMVALKRVSLRRRPWPATHAGDGDGGASLATEGLTALAREFRTLATLRHPNIISVLEYGFDRRHRPFFTMELLDGARPLLPAAARAPRPAQIALLLELLDALRYLHRHGVLHRDLKPSNILVVEGRAGPTVRLVDFGLSTGEGDAHLHPAAGTLAYMAPELFDGARASVASDLFAVGVLACELLAGRHPFGPHGDRAARLRRMLDDAPDLADLPPAIAEMIGAALARAPEARPRDAATFARALARAAGLPRPAETSAARESHLVAARFTGREPELQRLAAALGAARRGEGSAFLVGGESGAGKSRLVEEARSRALVEGLLVLRGHARATAGGSFHLFCEALEGLALHVDLDELEAGVLAGILPRLGALLGRDIPPPPPLDAEATRFRLLRVITDVVAKARHPTLLLLEDLHWADADSLDLLGRIGARVAGRPLLIVGTYRDDEAPRLPARLPAMEALRLGRLDRAGIERLCEAILGGDLAARAPGLVDLIERETEGNTYFIVETLRAIAEESGSLDEVGRRPLPDRIFAGGVEEVLARRLARVPAEARGFVELAAVAGRDLDPAALGALDPDLDARILLAADAGVFEMHERRWRFSHDKLRDRVLAALDETARRGLHARVAAAMAGIDGGASSRAAAIAHHYDAAGLIREGARFHAIAGEAALGRGALGAAEAELARACRPEAEGALSPLDRVRAFRGLAQARFGLGRLRDTDLAIRAACERAGQPLPRDLLGVALALARQAATQVVLRLGAAPLLPDLAGPSRAIDEELLRVFTAAEVYAWLAEPELTLLCTLRGLNLEESLGSRRHSNFPSALAFVLAYTPLADVGRRYIDRAAPQVVAGTQAEMDFLRVRALLSLGAGAWHEGARLAERACAAARAQKDDVSLLRALLAAHMARVALDDLPGMLAVSAEMERLAVRTENPRYRALALLGQGSARYLAGETAEAAALLDEVRRSLPVELGPVPEAIVLAVSSLCALQQGPPGHARAAELAREAVRVARRARWEMTELRYVYANVLEVFFVTGVARTRPDDVAWARRGLERLARRAPFIAPDVLLHEGHRHVVGGDLARAARCVRRSLALAEALAGRGQRARAHHWLGRIAALPDGRRHVPEGAAAHLRKSLALFEELGFARDAAEVRAALAALRS